MFKQIKLAAFGGALLIGLLGSAVKLQAAALEGEGSGAEAFAQLGELLPTPGDVRTAQGAPGPRYWQQRADYQISVTLDDQRQRLQGSVTIDYHNRSPYALNYLWLQLDQNRYRPDSDDVLTARAPDFEEFPYRDMASLLARDQFAGGAEILRVAGADGEDLTHTIVKTMLRIDLATPLATGERFRFSVDWAHNITDAIAIRTRGGYEYFPEDGNYIYEIAQWYPRMAAFTDIEGWQNKQFLGRGEFTLELGDYEVAITVPADHIVAATGELQNAADVLSAEQQQRLRDAASAAQPVFIVSPEEARANQQQGADEQRTWQFKAENVRDFAFASSRKFIWDAWGQDVGGRQVMAMSFYPNEAEPLWSRYSTQAIVHTIDVYSRYTFDYPYPVAISVNGPIGGMEYPMISFNKPRPYGDGTYWDLRQDPKDHTWERSKYGLISVIIHEVGHNYFPMIVNSDERQWTWMDEGLNTFLQFIAEQAWEEDYPSRRGEPKDIVEYMISEHKVPIMTNSESLLQFGSNAYGKPATALNILRESILGRELFDFAFREYARRWRFKRPSPADFFRTMEDASGIDLDWFWRGWFYGTGHVDVAIESVTLYQLDSLNPEIEKPKLAAEDAEQAETLSQQRNRGGPFRVERYPELRDFYNDFDEFSVTPYDYAQYQKTLQALEDRERVLLASDRWFYLIHLRNIGGLVTPLPLQITYTDGSVEMLRVPAEIWRYNAQQVGKLLLTNREIQSIAFDPYLETADADTSNNHFPREVVKSRFQLFKQEEKPNPMLQQRYQPDEDG
ncbi:MAG: M1 family metallopeptidase [Wenzhouxiangellaceae bacterium]